VLLAEVLTLMVVDDRTGRPVCGDGDLDVHAACAVLLELELRGGVQVAPGAGGRPHVWVRSTRPTGEEVLDAALQRLLVAGRPLAVADVLAHLRAGLRPVLLARLVAHGLLRYEESRVLGVLRRDLWLPADPRTRSGYLGSLREVLLHGRAPGRAEARVAALLGSLRVTHRVLPATGVPPHVLHSRARAAVRADGVAEAVVSALEASRARASEGWGWGGDGGGDSDGGGGDGGGGGGD
jgi:hypothetical protein